MLTRGNFRHGDDAIIPAFRRLTDACREANPGVVMIHQLYHVGQHGDADNSFAPNWSPSGLPSYHDADGSHAMTEAEIEELIEGFVAAAGRAQASGFDGDRDLRRLPRRWSTSSGRLVEPADRQWGGIVREPDALLVARSCGGSASAAATTSSSAWRVSADPDSPAMLSVEELAEIVALARRAAADGLRHVRHGLLLRLRQDHPAVALPAAARRAVRGGRSRRVVRHALVQAESHIRTPAAAEAVLAAGHADMVSIVRGQIADPHLVAKARAGRADEVRPCISCNQLCWGRRSRDYWISCLVNPSAGREFEWGGDRFEPAARPRRVLVVGGGPAGLEAARVAAERGHHVTLMERGPELGGQFRLAGLPAVARPDHRPDRLVRPAARRPRRGRPAGRRGERSGRDGGRGGRGHRGDRVAPAADRVPAGPAEAWTGCPAWMARTSSSIQDVLDGAVLVGPARPRARRPQRLAGLGTATHLAEADHDVTIVTAAAVVAGGLYHSAADGPLRKRFAEAGGRSITSACVLEWRAGVATIRSTLTGEVSTLEADALVIAETPVSETGLAADLTALGVPFHEIGDAVAPRRASLAFFEARELARRL